MSNIDILILYEHVDRELDVACIIRCLAEARHGLRVKIIQHPLGALRPDAEMLWLNPRLVVLPHCYRSAVYAPYLLDWPNAIYFSLMWEQIFYRGNSIAKIPQGPFSLNHVMHQAWGEFSANYLMAAGVPRKNIFTNSHPAYALYAEPYRRFYADRAELAQRYRLDLDRRWVFFPENYNWAFYTERTLSEFIGLGQKAEDVYAMRDFARASFAETMRWCQALARRSDVEIIVRPRPATRLDDFKSTVRQIVPELPEHLHVIKDESVREWILASDLTVSSHSTSLIEAAVAEKPAYMLVPLPIPHPLVMTWHELTPQLTSQAEFEAVCQKVDPPLRDTRLRDWTHGAVMLHSDPISNLVEQLVGILRGSIPCPPRLARADIETPQGEPITTAFQFYVEQLGRKLQHLSVQIKHQPVQSGPAFEKDLISQAEIDQRTNHWCQALNL